MLCLTFCMNFHFLKQVVLCSKHRFVLDKMPSSYTLKAPMKFYACYLKICLENTVHFFETYFALSHKICSLNKAHWSNYEMDVVINIIPCCTVLNKLTVIHSTDVPKETLVHIFMIKYHPFLNMGARLPQGQARRTWERKGSGEKLWMGNWNSANHDISSSYVILNLIPRVVHTFKQAVGEGGIAVVSIQKDKGVGE